MYSNSTAHTLCHPGPQQRLNARAWLPALLYARTPTAGTLAHASATQPSYFVAHAWSGDFIEMLDTLVDR